MSDASINDLVDLSTFPNGGGVGFTDRVIRGARVVLEWVARAWLTVPGRLVWDPGTPTVDIAQLENADPTPTELEVWRARLENAAREVDYVAKASVVLAQRGEGAEILGDVVLANGRRYRLGVTIDEAARAILRLPPEVT